MKKIVALILIFCVVLCFWGTCLAEAVNLTNFVGLHGYRMGELGLDFHPGYGLVGGGGSHQIVSTAAGVIVANEDLTIQMARITFFDLNKEADEQQKNIQNAVVAFSALEYDHFDALIISKSSDGKETATSKSFEILTKTIMSFMAENYEKILSGYQMVCYEGVYTYTLSYSSDDGIVQLIATLP